MLPGAGVALSEAAACGGSASTTEKQRALEAVQRLPDDATVEDAIERLCFIAKVHIGTW